MASITRFYALVLSTVLLLTGIPGVFPSILSFGPIVTFFALTLVHAVAHVAVGALGLLMAALASDDSVRTYTLGIALLFGVLAGVGIAGLNLAPVLYFNQADNWLHASIFALSLGVFMLGITEDRIRERKQRIIETLPASSKAATTASPRTNGAPVLESRMEQHMSAPGGDGMLVGDVVPWYKPSLPVSQPHQPPPPLPMSQPLPSQPEPRLQDPWGYGPQPQFRPPASQPAVSQPPTSQPAASQPRDPWTREQRRMPYQQSPRLQGTSSQEQSQSQPQSQPSPAPSPWDPWPREPEPQDAQSGSRQGDQWPLNEWPLHDS